MAEAFDWRRWVRPRLTRSRVAIALAVAIVADGAQLLAGPIGFGPIDDIVDIVTMALVTPLIGFHPLLLPTFVLELVPVAGMLPTWTGSVVAVGWLRRKELQTQSEGGVRFKI